MIVTNGSEVIALPSTLRHYGTTDWATLEPKKGKKEPDFTEHGVWGIDSQSRLFALDWWSKQAETDKGALAFCQLVRKWKPIRWWNEGGTIDKAVAPHVRKMMRDEKAFTVLESLPSMEDKGLKLQSFHALVANHMVFFPMQYRWAEEVIEQLIKFPGGRWDDKADACGLIGRAIDQMFDAQVQVEPERHIMRPFTEEWLTYNDSQKPKVRFFS
jgi:predicted phage terminase large subunit-like protein